MYVIAAEGINYFFLLHSKFSICTTYMYGLRLLSYIKESFQKYVEFELCEKLSLKTNFQPAKYTNTVYINLFLCSNSNLNMYMICHSYIRALLQQEWESQFYIPKQIQHHISKFLNRVRLSFLLACSTAACLTKGLQAIPAKPPLKEH